MSRVVVAAPHSFTRDSNLNDVVDMRSIFQPPSPCGNKCDSAESRPRRFHAWRQLLEHLHAYPILIEAAIGKVDFGVNPEAAVARCPPAAPAAGVDARVRVRRCRWS